MSTRTRTATRETATPDTFKAPFEATAKARAKLSADELAPINVDVRMVIATVAGALPNLKALRADMEHHTPHLDFAELDAIPTYSAALGYAHSAYLTSVEPTDPLPELATRAAALRDQLLSDARALARRKLLNERHLEEVQGGNGYLNTVSDLGILIRVLRESWSAIASKSAIEESEIEEAERLYNELNVAYGGRANPTVRQGTANDDRQRAFTLLVRAYRQARRAVIFLRDAEGDAERLVPSLFKGRGRASAKSDPGVTPEEPAGPTDEEPSGPVDPAGPATPVEPGLPGGSPFL